MEQSQTVSQFSGDQNHEPDNTRSPERSERPNGESLINRPGSICLFFVVIATIFCLASVANAERAKGSKGEGQVSVTVRTVMATGVRTGSSQGQGTHVGKKIHDLTDKLSKLHYQRYTLVSSRNDVVSMQQKKVLSLGKGHTLALRPMYIKGNRVGMWLNWKDEQGAKLLDTRMHFTCGESVVTGTERSADSGLILAIDVTPH
jgi:hypothetical protein